MTKLTKAQTLPRGAASVLALVALAVCAVALAPVASAATRLGHDSKAGQHGAEHRRKHKVVPGAHHPAHKRHHGHISGIVPVVHGRVRPHRPGEVLEGPAAESAAHVDLGLGTSANRENLEYHGGPVLHTNTTYAIYWLPVGQTVSAKYTSLINGYFTNVALASGYSSNIYATGTQFYDGEGAVSSKSTFGGSYVDTTTPIPDDCSPEYSETPVTVSGCVTDADLQAEVSHAIAAAGWTPGPTKEFFIFTPRNVGSCLNSSSKECSYTLYCAYHANYTDAESHQVIYSNIADPDTSGVGVPGACDSYQHPNGDWADAAISIVSHEHEESVTDPFGNAWFDGVGNEDGDKCAWNFGTALGSATYGKYNQVIGRGKYYVQQEWSNASRSCALTYVPTPVVWSTSAEGGAIGSEVTITGANFAAAKYVYFNGTAATFTVLAPNTIAAKVPLGATSGLIAVTNASGTGKSTSVFYVAPTISSFSSTSGKVLTTVTVYGTNFTGATSVTIGGVSAPFKVSEAKKLIATVPLGAETATITVTGLGGTGTSSTDFTVVPWAPPTVSSFSSTSGKVGTSVTVYGTNFVSATAVTIGGVSATFKISEERKLVATVPLGAETGAISVTGLGGTGTSSTNFTVVPWAPPTVSSFSSTSGQVGASVTVYGTNFASATAVTIGGVSATFKVSEEKKLVATVPAGAETGAITVTGYGGTGTSSASFTVLS
jgi:hypothetical protein